MAHADPFPTAALDVVSRQVGSRLAGVVPDDLIQNVPIELAESFAIWMLALDATTRANEDLSHLARRTGRWHHQVRFGGQARAFAWSMPYGPDPTDWSIEQVSFSPIAERIDAAVEWIDQNVPDDPLVRLLVVPSYYLHAFWLHQDEWDRVLVIDRPEQYERVPYGVLSAPGDFLEALAREPHAVGVRPVLA